MKSLFCSGSRTSSSALAGSHPDVRLIVTDELAIKVDAVRELVGAAALRPAEGRWQVIVVEDADRLTDEAVLRHDLEDAVRIVWDHLHVVPVDQRCLDRAAGLARSQPVRLSDAVHLAAAERLPGPIAFVTFDPAQIGVALGLGFEVVSS